VAPPEPEPEPVEPPVRLERPVRPLVIERYDEPEIEPEVVHGSAEQEEPEEIDFAELLEGDRSVIELAPDPSDEEESAERGSSETVVMDNGSIRSFNTDNFRVPTFVRKQID
jgi:hypothetical protein